MSASWRYPRAAAISWDGSIGKTIRVGNEEFLVVGVMEKIGSVLGQDQDNFIMAPLPVFLRMQGYKPA